MQTDSIEHDRQIALQALKGLDVRGYSAMTVHVAIINEDGVRLVNLNPSSKTFNRLMDEQTKRLLEEAMKLPKPSQEPESGTTTRGG